MDTKTNMNTNPSSGYPKDDMMDNITKMNTSPLSGYPKEEMMDNSSVRMSLYCPPFQFEDA
jgi:hypothetical protein